MRVRTGLCAGVHEISSHWANMAEYDRVILVRKCTVRGGTEHFCTTVPGVEQSRPISFSRKTHCEVVSELKINLCASV